MTPAGVFATLGTYDFDNGFFISGMLLANPSLLVLGTGENNMTLVGRTLP